MTLNHATRLAYGLLGTLYIFIGVGSMLLPPGWLPGDLAERFLVGEPLTPFFGHLLQEFGTVVIALGLVFLWRGCRPEHSPAFHWAMTFYCPLDALIHWVGPQGVIGSLQRGIVNSIPAAVLLVLGLLRLRASGE